MLNNMLDLWKMSYIWKNSLMSCIVAVLFLGLPLPVLQAQPSPYHYAQRSSYPFGCRDVASKKEVGKYHLLVQYRFTVNISAEDGSKKYTPDYDIMNLEIGDSFSRYYSSSADKCDSIVFNARNDKRFGDRGVDAYGWMKGGRLALYEDYYQDYPEKGCCTVRMGIGANEYEYVDETITFQWKYNLAEKRDILGYSCLAAETNFRGRCYKVWFTPDIPSSRGPWKFYGLPGLIMAAEDEDGIFKWEAAGISSDEGKMYIFDPSAGHTPSASPMVVKRVSRKQGLELEKRKWSDPQGPYLEAGTISIVDRMENGRMVSYTVTAENRELFAYPPFPQLELE